MPHPLRYRLFYTTRQKIVTSVLALALLAWGTVYAVGRLTTPEDRSCAPGVARPAGSGECVGVSGDGYDFEVAALREVAAAIGEQNRALKPGEYATVALLLPLTSTSPSMRTKILHEVQGAFAGQYEANHKSNDMVPKIRLVLANTGNGNAHWRTAVDALKGMTGAPHHLRVVSGIATSSAPVRQAVAALTGEGIAVVGTTITADDLTNGPGRKPFPGLARVSPTNSDEARALADYGRVDAAKAAKAILVHDTREGDHYTRTLKEAFSGLLAKSPYQAQVFTSPDDPTVEGPTANTFQQITHLLCTTRADTVFFAGRHTQLRQFVNALGARGCTHKPFTVLTGDEGSYLGADPKLNRGVLGKGLTVRYAALAHPDAWRPAAGRAVPRTGGSPEAYERFRSMMDAVRTARVGPVGPVELSDGQAIVAYDAMAAAVRAIRRATVAGKLPAPREVGLQWPQVTGGLRVEGASGWICLDNHGNPYNKAVPVVELTRDTPRFVRMAWPDGGPPSAECMPPRER
ncbi:ABC transporter substrate-binding protein [Streptomyces sp. NPDC047821]|uniref:ABC transporter substrate-binding protein n=1 Tax=unclassified Streptomyces TaxID=2593676 RepID=UPI00363650A4